MTNASAKIACAILFAHLLAGCVTAPIRVMKLSPEIREIKEPELCKILTVTPDSPAAKAGIAMGDIVQAIGDSKPKDAHDALELIAKAGTQINLSLFRNGKIVKVKVEVEAENSQQVLGFSCDMTGAQQAVGDTVFATQGPYQLVAANVMIKNGMTMVWIKITNSSDHPIQVSPEMFSAASADKVLMNAMSMTDVQQTLFGDIKTKLMAEQASAAWMQAGITSQQMKEGYATQSRTQFQPPSLGDWYSYGTAVGTTVTQPEAATRLGSSIYSAYAMAASARVQAEFEKATVDAESISKNTFVPASIPSGFSNAGFIYFREPATLPMTLMANIEGKKFAFFFNEKTEELDIMAFQRYVQTVPIGDALMIRLKNGQEIVGNLTSYDYYHIFVRRPEGEVHWYNEERSINLIDIVNFKAARRNTIHIKPAKPIHPEDTKKSEIAG
jgi:hypothetical protein